MTLSHSPKIPLIGILKPRQGLEMMPELNPKQARNGYCLGIFLMIAAQYIIEAWFPDNKNISMMGITALIWYFTFYYLQSKWLAKIPGAGDMQRVQTALALSMQSRGLLWLFSLPAFALLYAGNQTHQDWLIWTGMLLLTVFVVLQGVFLINRIALVSELKQRPKKEIFWPYMRCMLIVYGILALIFAAVSAFFYGVLWLIA
jgi:hypothetical protein